MDRKHNEKISDFSGLKLRNDLQLEALMAASYDLDVESYYSRCILIAGYGGAERMLEERTDDDLVDKCFVSGIIGDKFVDTAALSVSILARMRCSIHALW